MIDIFMTLLGALLVIIIILLLRQKKYSQKDALRLDARFASLEMSLQRLEQSVRQEAIQSRNELGSATREQRQELAQSLKYFGDTVSTQLLALSKTSGEKLDNVRLESAGAARQLREEVILTLKSLSDSTSQTMNELGNLQKSRLADMSDALTKLAESNEKKMEAVKSAVEGRLQAIQTDNAWQLEQMRQTVNEKLQGALEKRLGDSFRLVSERLELVHQGLGEMQNLAAGVGDLKKALTNIKTRGVWGETQLGMLLEQTLCADQFAANISMKDNAERVEFAVKLPGQDEKEIVWLPIDAKFPVEDYQRLMEAQEKGDVEKVEQAGKQLENRVKICAKDICTKYLNPPKTTDFAILFLPVEGLFAEVIRRTSLVETIRRDCRVVIAGPATLWSLLNSLQMGFRTLAIQKRTSEVWRLLAAVKTEWNNYGEILDNVQKKLHSASETLEKAKTRSKAIGRKLKDVETLPPTETTGLTMEEEVVLRDL